jgi:hypothetical protein
MSTIPNGKYVEPRQTIFVPWSSFWYAQAWGTVGRLPFTNILRRSTPCMTGRKKASIAESLKAEF